MAWLAQGKEAPPSPLFPEAQKQVSGIVGSWGRNGPRLSSLQLQSGKLYTPGPLPMTCTDAADWL